MATNQGTTRIVTAVLCGAATLGITLADPAVASAQVGAHSLNLDEDWQLLVGDGATVPAGFGRQSWAVTAAQEWRGALFLGTSTYSAYGCQVWKIEGGADPVQVNVDGFGNPDTNELPAMAVFGDRLYAGTSNYDYAGGDSGARLWRTADGITWEPSSSPGFGDPFRAHLTSLAVFDGHLYAGIGQRSAGPPLYEYSVQVWRSPTGDPGSWELVYEEATDAARRYVAGELVVFDGRLYVVLADPETLQPPKLRRTSDGTSWEAIPDFDLQCGFTFGGRAAAVEFGGFLVVASMSDPGSGPACRSANGIAWDPMEVAVTSLATFGGWLFAGQPEGGMFRSADGLSWTAIGPDVSDDSTVTIAFLDGSLYAGTMAPYDGCELWRHPTPLLRLPARSGAHLTR